MGQDGLFGGVTQGCLAGLLRLEGTNIMLNKFRIGAAGVAFVAAVGLATSANAKVTASATAEAVILPALTLDVMTTTNTSLNFGTIAPNGAGTVVLAATSAATASCSTNLICTGASNSVGFDVTGGKGSLVAVTIPAGGTTLSGGGDTMTVNTFTTDADPAGITLDATTGAASFYVGGTLHVKSGQLPGNYSGTFNVSVAYQ